MKHLCLWCLVLAIVVNFLPSPVFAAPQISNLSLNANSIPKYSKLEITFQVQSTAQNYFFPFDANPPAGITPNTGITVNALFLPPGQSNWDNATTQPAFYYQDFTPEIHNNLDWFYPTGLYAWKVRFAPPTIGTWQYRLIATDSSGTSQSSPQTFTVSSSNNPGFIRVSSRDNRYFEFEDGTYFPGLGYNLRLSSSNSSANAAHLQTMGQNGIQLGRFWLSSWSIFGSQWNPWYAMPNDYDGYLPRTGLEAFDGDFRLKLVYRASNPNQPSCTDNCSYWKATRFIGWMNPQAPVKPNTNYRIRVRYFAQNLTGPKVTSSPTYGLVIKTGGWLTEPHLPGTGTVLSTYGGNTANWTELTGSWTSGTNTYFLPNLYLSLENVIDPGANNPAATAYIDSVYIEENLGNNQFGPNILPKPIMNQLTYVDQRNSFAFDKTLDQAAQSGVYLRPVILEKDEYLQNHIDFTGALRTDDVPNLFYGNGRTLTAVRWYQQAYWRYLQARWGYSTAIHSWELVNEGNPALTNHYLMTDELGKYMRLFTPNHHLVSTSNWHSFNPTIWNSYPNIDFGDVHDYIGEDTEPTEFFDLTNATLTRSSAVSSYNGPVIRGETGLISTVNNTDGFTTQIPCTATNHQGLWLKNLLWASLNANGLIESYWYNPEHIYPNQRFDCNNNGSLTDESVITYDHRPLYQNFANFLFGIPLSNGHYQDLGVTNIPSNLRVIGQKDLVNNRAHFWVQNASHTWKNVVDNVTIAPISTTLTLTGFAPNLTLPLERWDTSVGDIAVMSTVTTSTAGTITLPLSNLVSDVAYRVGNYDSSPPPVEYDFLDLLNLIRQFNQNYNIFDFNTIINNL